MKTFQSTSQHLTFLTMKIRNKSIFWWFDKFGVLKATSNSLFGKLIQKRGDPIFGLELKYAIRNGDVAIKERTIGGKEIGRASCRKRVTITEETRGGKGKR